MKIQSINLYRDGGTREIITDEGTFFALSKIDYYGKFRGRVTTNFPSKGGVLVPIDVEEKIKNILIGYEFGFVEGREVAERLFENQEKYK